MFDTRFYPYPDHRYLLEQDMDEEIKSQYQRYKYTHYICFSCKHKADDNPYCECCEHFNKYEGSIIRTEECLNMNYKGTQSLPKIENVIFAKYHSPFNLASKLALSFSRTSSVKTRGRVILYFAVHFLNSFL